MCMQESFKLGTPESRCRRNYDSEASTSTPLEMQQKVCLCPQDRILSAVLHSYKLRLVATLLV
jgi:hypothetical protein